MAYSDEGSSRPFVIRVQNTRVPPPRTEERRPQIDHRRLAEQDITDNVRDTTRRPSRRKSRKHVERAPEPAFEDSDDVLDDYYAGGSPVSGEDNGASDNDVDAYEANIRPSGNLHSFSRPPPPAAAYPDNSLPFHPEAAYPANPFDYPLPPGVAYPESPYGRPVPYPPIRHRPRPAANFYADLPEYWPIPHRSSYMSRPPESDRKTSFWLRAAKSKSTSPSSPLSARLRLVVTRSGERYKGRDIPYTKGTWDDVTFARRLKEEYRVLKTTKFGIQEIIASYLKIHFVNFRQYRATASRRLKGGKWNISDLVPITKLHDESARRSFMYKLQKFASGRRRGGPKKWMARLDDLIEPGAVIDLEVLETFDVKRICMGLLIAIFVSLAIALAYGFAMDQDFSTGFSIASWIITAAGFFAAIVALFGDAGSGSLRASLSAEMQDA